jgi:hypothetical protein
MGKEKGKEKGEEKIEEEVFFDSKLINKNRKLPWNEVFF